MLRLLLGLIAVLLTAAPAEADELRPGYLELTQTSAADWTLVWKAPMRGGVTPATQPVLPSGCASQGPPTRKMVTMSVISTFKLRCSDDVTGKMIGLSNLTAAQTDVLVRVAPLGRAVQTWRLTAAAPQTEIAATPGRRQVAWTYFAIGTEHILFGYDHLLFVVAIVLLLSNFRAMALAITSFTVAHSLTLVGTTLGFLGLPQKPVEAIIALSIIFLAAEIIKKKEGAPRLSERLPWVVAFAFGLLHGFGFAGALAEIGLPASDVPTALFTFNIGVEAGQLLIVAATMLVLFYLRRWRPLWVRPAILLSAYGIGSIAAMWMIERVVS